MYKIGFEKSSGSHYLYSGNKNKDTPFYGSKTACMALLVVMKLDFDISFKIMKAWVALNEGQMEGMNEDELEEYINLIGYPSMTRMKRIREAEALIKEKQEMKSFLELEIERRVRQIEKK